MSITFVALLVLGFVLAYREQQQNYERRERDRDRWRS